MPCKRSLVQLSLLPNAALKRTRPDAIASPSSRVKATLVPAVTETSIAPSSARPVSNSRYGPRPQSSGILSNCYRKLGQSPVAGVGALDGHVERLGWRTATVRPPAAITSDVAGPSRSAGTVAGSRQAASVISSAPAYDGSETASSTGLATKRRRGCSGVPTANQQIAADQRASGHLDAAFLSDLSYGRLLQQLTRLLTAARTFPPLTARGLHPDLVALAAPVPAMYLAGAPCAGSRSVVCGRRTTRTLLASPRPAGRDVDAICP